MAQLDEHYYADDTLGGRLLAARESAGLTMAALSKQIGVSASSVRDWECDRAAPQTDQLVRMAAVMGVRPLWLMSGDVDGAAQAPRRSIAADRSQRREFIDFSTLRRSTTDGRIIIGITLRSARSRSTH